MARLKEVNEQLKIECLQLEADNLDLQSEEESCSSDSDTDISQPASPDVEATFQKIIGSHKYTPEVRKLYYSLIADQVPVSKISDIIRSVLKCSIAGENQPSGAKTQNELFIPCCSPYLALSSGACGASIRASVPKL